MTRQQTLRATLAWSFDLLEADEQVLLRRLAVFAGGFGLEAAEDVCAEDPLRRSEAVAVLGRLIDKSLVHVEEGSGDRRYRLLETVRQYAAERLEEAGERARLRAPPSRLVHRARRERPDAGRRPAGPDRAAAAWIWSATTSAPPWPRRWSTIPRSALRLAVALWRFWLMRGYLAEGYRWLDRRPWRRRPSTPRIAPAPCSPPA